MKRSMCIDKAYRMFSNVNAKNNMIGDEWVNINDYLPSLYEDVLIYAFDSIANKGIIDIAYLDESLHWNLVREDKRYCYKSFKSLITHWKRIVHPQIGEV